MTDNQLRILIKESPEKGHRLLFDEYYSYVYVIVYNRLKNCGTREDIDECVSDVFSGIFLCYDSENSFDGSLKGYIATLANRTAIDAFRRLSRKSRLTVSLDEELMREIPSEEKVDELAEKSETAHILLNLIEELGEPDSTIIMQKYYYNKSSKEIAGLLSLKADTVRQRCSRAVKRLKSRFAEFDISL